MAAGVSIAAMTIVVYFKARVMLQERSHLDIIPYLFSNLKEKLYYNIL
jgi:hypothetical protein